MSHHEPNKLETIIHNILLSKSKRVMVLLVTLAFFMGSIYLIPLEIVKAKMLPGKDSDTFSVYVDLPEGSSVAQTKEVTNCIATSLQKEQDVTAISVFLGEGLPLDFAGMVKGSALKDSENVAEIMVNIKRKEHRTERSYNMVQRIRPQIQKQCSINEANIKFIELPAGPPVLADVVAEVYGGNSFESRRDVALKIADVFKAQSTLTDVDVLADEVYTRYALTLNNNKVLESKVSLEQVKKILYLAFEGMNIGVVNEANAQNQIPIFLRLDDSRLFDQFNKDAIESKLASLRLMNQNGMMVPLSEFVTISAQLQEPTLNSKNLKHMINVIATTDMESQIYPLLDARSMMLNNPWDGYSVQKASMLNLKITNTQTSEVFDVVFDGELKVTIDTFIDLGGAFIGALVLIFLLMVVYYKNFMLAGMIVLASFVSIVGVILGHWVMDIFTADKFYLTATSLIGFIGLIGINSRNSLLIIDFAKQLMEEKHLDAARAIAVATATRAKPILLTVLAIVFASSLLATDAVFGGLGVALIGGTLAAYFVSLFFVPVIILGSLQKLQK
ncbi:MAG: efflux RND transporter permease subunit [Campylobacterales bacterium]|nr:efflux RND transporter permease subunit [Campylobacterales bacterium]